MAQCRIWAFSGLILDKTAGVCNKAIHVCRVTLCNITIQKEIPFLEVEENIDKDVEYDVPPFPHHVEDVEEWKMCTMMGSLQGKKLQGHQWGGGWWKKCGTQNSNRSVWS